MAETSPMLCGKCRVPVEGWTESDGNDWISCPACGQQDRLDDALGEATEYKIGKIMSGGLNAPIVGSSGTDRAFPSFISFCRL
jgi:hypothetical protein